MLFYVFLSCSTYFSFFVLFYVFLCCSLYFSFFLCCSIYFCVILCIFELFYVFFVFCVVLCIFVLFYVLFVCICVLYYCHRVATQLQLNISYHITDINGRKLRVNGEKRRRVATGRDCNVTVPVV